MYEVRDTNTARVHGGQGVHHLLDAAPRRVRPAALARSRGYRWLTLNVFAENLRAREVYKRLGYGEDFLKCIKELD